VTLRPVNTQSPLARDVELLSQWRNKNVKSFLTEFDSTQERTLRWLTQSVDHDDSRIIFMIENNEDGKIFGYIGLASIGWDGRSAEVDSVVRGVQGLPGLMSAALRALVRWGESELGLLTFSVRVLADNPALSFYQKLGFAESHRVSLVAEKVTDGVVWREDESSSAVVATRQLVHLDLENRNDARAAS